MKLEDIPAITLYAVSVATGSIVLYHFMTPAGDLSFLFLLPIFCIVSLISWFLPVSFAPLGIRKPFRSMANWATLMLLVWCIEYGYNYAMNRSKVVLFADFYWDAGIDLYLRENGTYKVVERGWIADDLKYGKYRVDGNRIITDGGLYLGIARLNDTLMYDSTGLHFQLDIKWKDMDSGVMTIQANKLFD
jgi:hypothetical protein